MDEQIDGWNVKIYHQGFSSIVKEPHIGADLGVIIDISNDASRVIKVLWFQAKRASHDHTPQSDQNLSGLSEQLEDMRKFTSDGYGLVYTPVGVMVLASEPDTKNYRLKALGGIEQFMEKALRCEYGDRRPSAIANTLDCKHIFGVTLMHSQYPKD